MYIKPGLRIITVNYNIIITFEYVRGIELIANTIAGIVVRIYVLNNCYYRVTIIVGVLPARPLSIGPNLYNIIGKY